MKTVESLVDLELSLPLDKPVGFVPTMGALHNGHLELVKAAKNRGLFTVVSIFVNPTQFNDPADFEKYPVDIRADITLLKQSGCDLIFVPRKKEIYPEGKHDDRFIHDFGDLESRFEGEYRPGHFRGVAQVVHILFEAVMPDVAFFGEKDFQQLQIIKALVEKNGMDVEIVGVPTVREADGLAMSSRNLRLTAPQRKKAKLLFEALSFAKSQPKSMGTDAIKKEVTQLFDADKDFRLEYFEIIDDETFSAVDRIDKAAHPRALIAAYLGEVRLIDNLSLA